MNSSYVDELERQLSDFSSDWEDALKKRIFAWRVRLLIGVALSLLVPWLYPDLFWLWIVVLGMSAGSLFSLLKSNVKMQKHMASCREHIRKARMEEEKSQ